VEQQPAIEHRLKNSIQTIQEEGIGNCAGEWAFARQAQYR
jgi:hypothetical protein